MWWLTAKSLNAYSTGNEVVANVDFVNAAANKCLNPYSTGNEVVAVR